MQPIDPIRVLLIDDDEDDYIFTRDFLEEGKHTRFALSWTPHPAEGLDLILAETFDVYLIDLYLGQANGLELVEKGVAAGCQKPLILLTGSGDRENDMRALELGAADYLVKGEFNADMLQRAILYALRHRQTLNALSLSEMRYRGVIETQTELICRFNPDTTLTFANEAFARYFQIDSEKLIGRKLSGLLQHNQKSELVEKVEKVCQHHRSVTFESQIEKGEEEAIWQQWTLQPIFDGEQKRLEIQAVGVDITGQKLSEQVLRQALERERELGELKSRFVTIASHEFRTPLTTIMSTSSYLEIAEGKISPEKRVNRLIKIQVAAQNMTELINDVLTYGRGEAEMLEFRPIELDLGNFVEEIVEEITAAHKQTDVIHFHNDLSINRIWIDEKLMRQVLTNLISNGLKYSPLGTAVQVTLSNGPKYFHVEVTDNGIGIPEKDQSMIFDPFHRASNAYEIAGTGLGLAITKKGIEKHGGEISFASIEGEGTTFFLSLPIYPNKE